MGARDGRSRIRQRCPRTLRVHPGARGQQGVPRMKNVRIGAALVGALMLSGTSFADEGLFGYVKGAEPLPKGAVDFEQWFTVRSDKGQGDYTALDTKTEIEWGITDRFSTAL